MIKSWLPTSRRNSYCVVGQASYNLQLQHERMWHHDGYLQLRFVAIWSQSSYEIGGISDDKTADYEQRYIKTRQYHMGMKL